MRESPTGICPECPSPVTALLIYDRHGTRPELGIACTGLTAHVKELPHMTIYFPACSIRTANMGMQENTVPEEVMTYFQENIVAIKAGKRVRKLMHKTGLNA
jgi:hypothetical protein